MPDCDAQCILLGKGTLQRLRRPNSEPYRASDLKTAQEFMNSYFVWVNIFETPVIRQSQIRILAGALDRPEIMEKCESAGVVQSLVYTSSTPTHTNGGEQPRNIVEANWLFCRRL